MIGADLGLFTYEVSAEVDIWGPEFSGLAKVDLSIKTFEIEFGASEDNGLTPISWNTFKSAFLPPDNEICSARIVAGTVYEIERDVNGTKVAIPVINPKELKLETTSAIPASTGILNPIFDPDGEPTGTTLTGTADALGVAPMNLPNLNSTQIITIERENGDGTFSRVDDDEFRLTAVQKKFPQGMWGTRIDVDMNADMLDAISGYTIDLDPLTRVAPGSTKTFARKQFNQEPPTEKSAGMFNEVTDKIVYTGEVQDDDNQRRSELAIHVTGSRASNEQNSRNAILNDLGIEPAEAVSISENFADSFVIPPQLIQTSD